METTSGRIVAMASYPDYNPNVWASGISQGEVNYLFGLGGQSGSGEPALNWATQGQYAPGSTFKVTSTAAAVANGYRLNGLYDCPASVTIGGAHVHQRRRAGPGRHDVLRGADPVLRHRVLQHRLRDVPDRRPEGQQRAQPEGAHPEDAADGAGLGVRQLHRRRPAGGVHRHDPDPPVALQHVGGQRAQGPELVQEREGATARTCSRSSTRTASTAGCGSQARRRSPRSARAT